MANKGMGDAAKVSSKAKNMPKYGDGKVVSTGFTEANSIFPQDEAKKKNPGMEKDLFGPDALTSGIPADGKYASKNSKKPKFDPSVFKFIEENKIFPDAGYDTDNDY